MSKVCPFWYPSKILVILKATSLLTPLTLIRGVKRNSHPAVFPVGSPILPYQPTVSAKQWVDNCKVTA